MLCAAAQVVRAGCGSASVHKERPGYNSTLIAPAEPAVEPPSLRDTFSSFSAVELVCACVCVRSLRAVCFTW